jgi:lysophospholipase L1-like esterase
VTVLNKAIGGRSSRSFIEDGHWATTLALLQKGDYLLISFGTNDRGMVTERHTDTAGFRLYLTQYVTESRAKGAIPILVSTINQNTWSGTTFTEGFTIGANDYRGAMLRVVNALNVPFVDLEKKSATLFQSLGQSYLNDFIFSPGQATHFQEMGAINIAKLIAQGIQELSTNTDVSPLAAALATQYMVTIRSNKSTAGMITASGTYPQGTPMTIEAVPNTGETFVGWLDASAKSVSTLASYSFTMAASPVSYIASFKGGVTHISGAAATETIHAKPSVFFSGKGMLSIVSSEKILSVRIIDISGKSLLGYEPNATHAAIDIRAYAQGTYFVETRTNIGVTTHSIQR